MTLFQTLLICHIIGGFTALLTAAVAALSKWFPMPHKVHAISGGIYVLGMAIVFVTSLPMAVLHPSLFLFLIAIFSFYLTLSGLRLARNRKGTPTQFDWGLASAMAITGLLMIGFGIFMVISRDNMGIVAMVFGAIGLLSSLSDIRRFRRGGVKGKARIAEHLTAMLGATIATLTAFVVTNFTLNPQWLLWLLPTFIITPIIVYWRRRVVR